MSEKTSSGAMPEALMDSFKGVSLVKMLVFTIVVHVVIIGSTSLPYLKKAIFGDAGKLTRDERVTKAVAEATSALRQIAAENGLNPQDISDRFAGGRAPAAGAQAGAVAGPAVDAGAAPAGGAAQAPSAAVPEKAKSPLEQQLEQKAEGPKVPGVGGADDIF